jgi:hypothetical protein
LTFTSLAVANSECKPDAHTEFGPEQEIQSDAQRKVFLASKSGSPLSWNRYCQDAWSELEYTEIFFKGRKIAIKNEDRLSGGRPKDLQLFDEHGHVRVIVTLMSGTFSRAMVFSESGKIVFINDSQNNNSISNPAKVTDVWNEPVEAVNQFLLDQFSQSQMPKNVVLTWLLLYHGEGPGMTISGQLEKWRASHKNDAERLFKIDE